MKVALDLLCVWVCAGIAISLVEAVSMGHLSGTSVSNILCLVIPFSQ